MFFSKDSAIFNQYSDSIEFNTGGYISIMLDSANIYVSHNSWPVWKYSNQFNVEITAHYYFDTFFISRKREIGYLFSYIFIDTGEYDIMLDNEVLKEGNIYGGW